MVTRRDPDDPAVEVIVERKPVPAVFEQARESPADMAEADEREISAHERRQSPGALQSGTTPTRGTPGRIQNRSGNTRPCRSSRLARAGRRVPRADVR